MATGTQGGGGGGSLAIENCKGHVHVFSDSGGGQSGGFYRMSPPIPEADGSKALLLGIPVNFNEIVQPTVTLDDKRVLYLFGTAWNDLSVTGLLLLGEQSTRGDQFAQLMGWYDENRVSVKKGPVQVSIGTARIDAFVTGLRTAQANPVNNTQPFTILMVTADMKP